MTGLFIIWVTKLYILDSIVAIITALFIMKAAYEITHKSVKGLMDQQLPPEEEELIKEIILEHYDKYVSFHNLRTRKSGAERFVDLHLVVKEHTTVKEAHDFCNLLEEDIKAKLKHCNVLIHIEPDSVVPTGVFSEKDVKKSLEEGEKT